MIAENPAPVFAAPFLNRLANSGWFAALRYLLITVVLLAPGLQSISLMDRDGPKFPRALAGS